MGLFGILVVLIAEIERHQKRYVAANQFVGALPEQGADNRIDAFDYSLVVDGDNALGGIGDNLRITLVAARLQDQYRMKPDNQTGQYAPSPKQFQSMGGIKPKSWRDCARNAACPAKPATTAKNSQCSRAPVRQLPSFKIPASSPAKISGDT